MEILKKLALGTFAFSGLFLTACGGASGEAGSNGSTTEVSIGVVGDVSRQVWENVADRLSDDGIDLEVMTFSDYVQPNRALEGGDLDLNAFQHVAFLSDYVADSGSPIVPIGYSIMSPMYVFSTDEISDVESIPDGATVAVSNSPTNAERSFLGLEAIGLIELDDNAGYAPTVDDITENHKNIEILEVNPNQLARSLGDADLITIGGDMLADAGMDPDGAIYTDTDNVDNVDPRKKNVIATTRDKADSEVLQRVVDEYQSPETAEVIDEIAQGASIPIWEEEDTAKEDFEAVLEEVN